MKKMKLPYNTDFNYIFSHSDACNFEIPHFYDTQKWEPGETYRIRISNVYDLSKFWIVLKERELDLFQKFITNFYSQYGSYYKMTLNTVSKNKYCVAFTDNTFFRGIIVNIPPSLSIEKQACVFLFDFGYMSMINLNDLYYLSEKLYNIPRFSVRASLSCVQPNDNYTWDSNVVKRFNELVANKILLCIVDCLDNDRKIVQVRIGIVNELSSVTDVTSILINEKVVKNLTNKKELTNTSINNNSRYNPKTKYSYMFPSFEAIEEGSVPSSVHISEMIKQCTARDVLFKPYFTYKGTSE